LIFESPEAFAARNNDETDSYIGAWRAYHKALLEAGIFVGGSPLRTPETGTTVRLKDGKRRVQDGPFADTKEQLGGCTILERHSLIDQVRHQQVVVASEPTLMLLRETQEEMMLSVKFPDERLKLLFVCAHPAIDPALHTPLMLQAVLGMDAARIAGAFLVSPKTMGQRLARAKTKIRDGGMRFEIPQERELPQRLDAVVEAIYGAFGIGWDDMAGVDQRGRELAEEAIWLGRVLLELLPGEAEVHGLLALMLHCEARRAARRGQDG